MLSISKPTTSLRLSNFPSIPHNHEHPISYYLNKVSWYYPKVIKDRYSALRRRNPTWLSFDSFLAEKNITSFISILSRNGLDRSLRYISIIEQLVNRPYISHNIKLKKLKTGGHGSPPLRILVCIFYFTIELYILYFSTQS